MKSVFQLAAFNELPRNSSNVLMAVLYPSERVAIDRPTMVSRADVAGSMSATNRPREPLTLALLGSGIADDDCVLALCRSMIRPLASACSLVASLKGLAMNALAGLWSTVVEDAGVLYNSASPSSLLIGALGVSSGGGLSLSYLSSVNLSSR